MTTEAQGNSATATLTLREKLQKNDRSVSSLLDPRLKKLILLDNPETLDVMFEVPSLSEKSRVKLEEIGVKVVKELGVAHGSVTQEQLGELLELPEVSYVERAASVHTSKASPAADHRTQARNSQTQSDIAR